MKRKITVPKRREGPVVTWRGVGPARRLEAIRLQRGTLGPVPASIHPGDVFSISDGVVLLKVKVEAVPSRVGVSVEEDPK